jgi:hypothetical protein
MDELSPWSKEGSAGGSKFVITGGSPVVGVAQEVEGSGGDSAALPCRVERGWGKKMAKRGPQTVLF